MAVTVCCPCGYPLDCDQLELLISITCPRCKKELTLELGDTPERRRIALLSVIEGPHWIGEQFLLPVNEDVLIGKEGGNWLPLESDDVSEVHCALRLTPAGHLLVEDRKSQKGTWVGEQRIARARLGTTQSFRVGDFRLRFDLQAADGTTVHSKVGAPAAADEPRLSTMHSVAPRATIGAWLVRNRYIMARNFVMPMAWLSAIYHVLGLRFRGEPWTWRGAVIMGLLVLTTLSAAGRRVSLSHKYFKFAALVLLIGVAMFDMAAQLPAGGIASLCLSASLVALCLRVPTQTWAGIGGFMGAASVCIMAIAACGHAIHDLLLR